MVANDRLRVASIVDYFRDGRGRSPSSRHHRLRESTCLSVGRQNFPVDKREYFEYSDCCSHGYTGY